MTVLEPELRNDALLASTNDSPTVVGDVVVSLVVPTKNSVRTIERCLQSLRAQRYAHCEIIVVDNFSNDGTAEIAAALADTFISAGPERSAQRNLGLAAATGAIVGFIDSDMYLTPGVAGDALAKLGGPSAYDSAVVPEYSCGEGFFAACRAHEKRLYLGNPDVESARFFRTEAVRSVGGYREDLRAGEDWDLADRFEGAGHSVDRVGSPIWHDDGRVSLVDMFKKKQYYGASFADYIDQRTEDRPRSLARPGLLAKPAELVRHPVLTGGLVVLKAVETSGLAVGVWKARRKA